jgi:drug/metabolite transporter (DMT)-like permease
MGLRWITSATGSNGTVMVAGNLIAFASCLPTALPLPAVGMGDWLILVYLGVFQIGLAYVLVSRGIRHVPALEASLLVLLEPVLNPLWVWLAQGERPGPWSLLGGAIILIATAGRTLTARG